MASTTPPAARLIAIDGSRSADIAKSAQRLAATLQERGIPCVISRWDASGLFGDLAQAAGRANASSRTLALVYAADLAFRLRWEIRPALASGGVVIAAPYVDTAIAFGAGCGLPEAWLRELLRFALAPDVTGLARERKLDRTWKPRFDRGYPEYCAAVFGPGAARRLSKRTRAAVIAALEVARGRQVYRLSGSGIDEAAQAVTGTRPGAASPPSSRPRTARK